MNTTCAASVLPPIIGYPTRLSAKPGERLPFKVSSIEGLAFNAHVVRIHCADPNPAGPGLKMEKVDFGLRDSDSYSGVEQAVHKGSCAVGSIADFGACQELVMALTVQPTLHSSAMQTLMSLQTSDASDGLALGLRDGHLIIRRLGKASDPQTIELGAKIRSDIWTRLRITLRRNGKTTIEAVEVGVRETERHAPLAMKKMDLA